MKIIILLFLSLFGINTFAQNVDWVNAPINPIALKYKKEHFNIKGDVYAYGYTVFSKEGLMIYESGVYAKHYLYKDAKPYADTEGMLYEFNSQGYLSKMTYAYLGVQTQTYTHNAKGLLTKVINTKGYNSMFDYDEKGRLIKSIIGTEIKEFAYQNVGDKLIITEKVLSNTPVITNKQIYKDGIKIGTNETLFTLKFDRNKNIISYLSLLYYSDIEKGNNELSVVYTKPTYTSPEPLYNCEFYINEQQVGFLFKNVLQKKDLMVYNPFNEKYYIIEDVFKNEKSGLKQVFSKVIINGPYFLNHSSSLILGYKGSLLQNNLYLRKNQLKGYTEPAYLVYDKQLDQTFYGELDSTNTTKIFPLSQISAGENLVYVKYEEYKFVTVLNGQPYLVENPTHKMVGLKNGNTVILDANGVPIYFLPATSSATALKFYAGRKFNKATDQYSKQDHNVPTTNTAPSQNIPKNNTQNTIPPSTVATNCLTGDCANGYGKKNMGTVGGTIEGFFQNNQANGYGIHMIGNGDFYIGNLVNDKRQGYGTYYLKKDGLFYYGTWTNGIQNGYGYTVKNSKVTLAGYFTNGKLTTNMLTDNFLNYQYIGNCAGNCADGFGQYKYSSNSEYYGFFKNNKPQGVGVFRAENGNQYLGEFNQNRLEGTGVLTYSGSKEKYLGDFVNNNFNGKGMMMTNDLKIISYGNWLNGKLSSITGTTINNATITTDKPKLINVGNANILPETKAYFQVYNNYPENLKPHLKDLGATLKVKKFEGELLYKKYGDILTEIYNIDKDAAFQFMMKVNGDNVSEILKYVPVATKTFIQTEARKKVQNYNGTVSF
jgi:hypothetical protein